ncbi:GNAT family N-acetyltransferase [Cellvibrio sp. UBA7661]|uniref:GNAT family N-acetyltransferase n=1 Tax=Cellvibrio sp. UBA7661 TaxID=1946311 RepID=UPI002F35207B
MTDVLHLVEENRFVIRHEGDEAVLAYRLFNNAGIEAIDFYSTFVPPAFRGQGFAEKLVRAGLKWAKERNFELHASCWYVAKFIR